MVHAEAAGAVAAIVYSADPRSTKTFGMAASSALPVIPSVSISGVSGVALRALLAETAGGVRVWLKPSNVTAWLVSCCRAQPSQVSVHAWVRGPLARGPSSWGTAGQRSILRPVCSRMAPHAQPPLWLF